MVDFRKLPLWIAVGIAGLFGVLVLLTYFGPYSTMAFTWSLLILFIFWHRFVGSKAMKKNGHHLHFPNESLNADSR
jgi:hypothetical protein